MKKKKKGKIFNEKCPCFHVRIENPLNAGA